jgi:hypothetical protein
VSSQNDCRYCQTFHGAMAAHHLGHDEGLVLNVKTDFEHASISEKLKALLVIAGKTAAGGSSLLSSACAIATSTDWRRGRRTIPRTSANGPPASPSTAMAMPSRQ